MKVALLHPQCARPGGAIQMVLYTARALQDAGYRVELFTFEHNGSCFPDLQTGLIIQRPNFSSGIKMVDKIGFFLWMLWHCRHVDMIIANNPPTHMVAALIKLFIPRIRTCWWHHHIPWYSRPTGIVLRLKSLFERKCIIPHIDLMLATSYCVAERVEEYCRIHATVIHPVVSPPPELVFKKNDPLLTLFTHGRLEPGKGVDMVMRIFYRLQKTFSHIPMKLVVAGSGSLQETIQSSGVTCVPLKRWETFADLQEFGECIGVYCSTIDAFGMAPVETQMANILTFILDSGGARETLVSNVSGDPVGFLVDSEEDLFSNISAYVQKKALPKQVSNVNFLHTKEYFLFPRFSNDLLLFMRKNMGGK